MSRSSKYGNDIFSFKKVEIPGLNDEDRAALDHMEEKTFKEIEENGFEPGCMYDLVMMRHRMELKAKRNKKQLNR